MEIGGGASWGWRPRAMSATLETVMRRTQLHRCGAVLVSIATLAGCSEPGTTPGVSAKMSLTGGLFDAPFPSAHLDLGDGALALPQPTPGDGTVGGAAIEQLTTLLRNGTTGYSLSGSVYLPFDGSVNLDRIPKSAAASLEPASPVFMVNVDPGSDGYGVRVPIVAHFKATADTQSPAHILSVAPLQGFVLDPTTTYAVIVLRALGDSEGRPLFRARLLEELLVDDPIAGPFSDSMGEAFGLLNAWRSDVGSPDVSAIAAATVFTTGNPYENLSSLYRQVRTQPAPAVTRLAAATGYNEFCVVRATVSLPSYLSGEPPYASGGTLMVDADGVLVEQGQDDTEVTISIPNAPMPPGGYPLVIYSRGADGSATDAVDGFGPASGAGEGPAKQFALRNIATLGFAAPAAGDRGGAATLAEAHDLYFDLTDIERFRDLRRQAILDYGTLLPVAEAVEIDAMLCPDATTPGASLMFDPNELFVFGDAAGATTAATALALDSGLEGGVIAGAFGTYPTLLASDSPDVPNDLAATLGHAPGEPLEVFSPVLTLLQTSLGAIEPANWARAVITHPVAANPPKQLLILQAVPDRYRSARASNSFALSAGVDLILPAVDDAAVDEFALVGHKAIPAPAAGNIPLGLGITGVVVQRSAAESADRFAPHALADLSFRFGCFISTAAENGLATILPPRTNAAAACE